MRLVVYDLIGTEVAVLVDEVISIGRHKVVFDARSLASGTYVYHMTAFGFEQTRRLMLLKGSGTRVVQ